MSMMKCHSQDAAQRGVATMKWCMAQCQDIEMSAPKHCHDEACNTKKGLIPWDYGRGRHILLCLIDFDQILLFFNLCHLMLSVH